MGTVWYVAGNSADGRYYADHDFVRIHDICKYMSHGHCVIYVAGNAADGRYYADHDFVRIHVIWKYMSHWHCVDESCKCGGKYRWWALLMQTMTAVRIRLCVYVWVDGVGLDRCVWLCVCVCLFVFVFVCVCMCVSTCVCGECVLLFPETLRISVDMYDMTHFYAWCDAPIGVIRMSWIIHITHMAHMWMSITHMVFPATFAICSFTCVP